MTAARTEPTPGASSRRTYDAFISYSHAADSRLAPALERGLRRLTRAWYQRQALRIFRDRTSLAANHDLRGTIERALRESRYFVLLASPKAAQSTWVREEVRFWQEQRERETFLIALTDGVIRWDDAAGHFDRSATDALPEELLGWFPREPLWVDLSWTRKHAPGDLTLQHGRFRDDVATLAAPLHGRDKDEIDSEDVRQHRRAVWVARAVVTALALLLVLALVQMNNASIQRNIARQQTVVAQQQRALATQRALDAEAQVGAAAVPDTSLDMSLAALRIDPTAQARQTLVSTLLQTGYQGSGQLQPSGTLAGTSAFSPDGHLFASAYDKGSANSGETVLSIWNTTNPMHMSWVADLPGYGAKTQVTSIAFSPDDRLLAVVGGGAVELWTPTAAPRLLSSLPLPAGQGVAFSPEGTTLAATAGASADGTLETWNVADPAAPRLLARIGDVYYPQNAAFSPDGRILVTGTGGKVGNNGSVLWDVSDPRAPRRLSSIPLWDGEGGFAFGPGGKTLAITFLVDASLWDIADPAAPRRLATLTGHTSLIDTIAFSPDGNTLATGGIDDRVLLWDTTDPAHVPQPTLLTDDPASIYALVFVRGGQSVLTADLDAQVSQWRVTDNAPALSATLTDSADPSASALAVAVSPDSRVLATTGDDDAVILWNVANPSRPVRLARFATGAGPGSALAFSPDGTVLAVGNWKRQLSLWDIRDPASPTLLATTTTPGATEWLAFTPGGTTLAGGGADLTDGFPNVPSWSDLWNASDPRRPVVLHSFTNLGDGGALSPDGKTLVLPLSNGAVQAWDIRDPANPVQLPNPEPSTRQANMLSYLSDDLTFAPARGLAATTSLGNPPGATLWTYNGHGTASQLSTATNPSDATGSGPVGSASDFITLVSFDPSGNLLAAVGENLTTTIWDIADTAQPFTVLTTTSDTGMVDDAVFSPDDRLFIASSENGTIQVWSLNGLPAIAANPVGLACQITDGGFTRSQWAQYAPGIPYSPSCP